MTALRISIAGRDYEVACDDGQENHLKSLARALDGRVRSLSEALGKPAEAQLLMLAALTLSDELQDKNKEIEQLNKEIEYLKRDIRHSSQSFEQNKQIELESAVAATIHDIASRIEAIASELERV